MVSVLLEVKVMSFEVMNQQLVKLDSNSVSSLLPARDCCFEFIVPLFWCKTWNVFKLLKATKKKKNLLCFRIQD